MGRKGGAERPGAVGADSAALSGGREKKRPPIAVDGRIFSEIRAMVWHTNFPVGEIIAPSCDTPQIVTSTPLKGGGIVTAHLHLRISSVNL